MIGIIGAGISGLAVAHRLAAQDKPYVVLEASAQVGGVMQSKHAEGKYWLELGPNSLLCDSALLSQLRAWGLGDQVLEAQPVSKDRFIFRNGAYRKLPASPPALLFNGYFGWKTKWAIFRERSNRSTSPPNETLAAFFARRFGQEVVDYALDPFVAGVYAGDPHKLLAAYNFPVLLEYERRYGSVLKGLMANRTGERKLSVSFAEGMHALPAKLAEGLHVHCHAPVERIEALAAGGFRLHTPQQAWEVDQVVLALPAHPAAKLLEALAPAYAEALRKVRYAPMAAVHTVFPKSAIGFPPNGFGGLHPRKEGLFTAGHIWSSSTFAQKCGPDEVLFTSFAGGDQAPEHALLEPATIQRRVLEELQRLYRIEVPPLFQHFYRWEQAIPQYDEAMHAVYGGAPGLAEQGVHICSNWMGGVSIPDCLRKGQALADQL